MARKQPRSRLAPFLLISLAAHPVVGLLCLDLFQLAPRAASPGAGNEHTVDLVTHPPRSAASHEPRTVGPDRAVPREPASEISSRRSARATGRGRSTPRAGDAGEAHRLLAMRPSGSAKEAVASGPGTPGVDRLASFRPRVDVLRPRLTPQPEAGTQAERPRVTAREGLSGMTLARYQDGGTLLRNQGGAARPDPGAAGLLRLGTAKLGGRSGIQACDPYRGEPKRAKERVLLLLVDTSSSIVEKQREPAAIVCGAGAAIAALRRGYPVAVANFSSSVRYLSKTHDRSAIYETLSSYQKESTRLPPAYLFEKLRGVPTDLVLVSDAAIANVAQVAPGYARLLRSNPGSTARLFLLGTGIACDDCAEQLHPRSELCKVCRKSTIEPLRGLAAIGFTPEPVEHPSIAEAVKQTLARVGIRAPVPVPVN